MPSLTWMEQWSFLPGLSPKSSILSPSMVTSSVVVSEADCWPPTSNSPREVTALVCPYLQCTVEERMYVLTCSVQWRRGRPSLLVSAGDICHRSRLVPAPARSPRWGRPCPSWGEEAGSTGCLGWSTLLRSTRSKTLPPPAVLDKV